jgi:NAD(P)-dependent dehydrogenase (short-subunit alcohol dehydrogenase family)
VEADQSSSPITAEDRERVGLVSALARLATPRDVANAIVWLLSSKLSASTTGQIVRVDAGLSGRIRQR